MRAKPASFPPEGDLELTWTENSPSEQNRNPNTPLGWNQRPKLRIQNLTETYLKFYSYSEIYFCKYRTEHKKSKSTAGKQKQTGIGIGADQDILFEF